jgi:hypothetical protein
MGLNDRTVKECNFSITAIPLPAMTGKEIYEQKLFHRPGTSALQEGQCPPFKLTDKT